MPHTVQVKYCLYMHISIYMCTVEVCTLYLRIVLQSIVMLYCHDI